MTSLILAFGLCFQLPVVTTLLGMAGLISSKLMSEGRRYAIVAVVVLAAVVTPPDPISQLMLAVPSGAALRGLDLVRAADRMAAQDGRGRRGSGIRLIAVRQAVPWGLVFFRCAAGPGLVGLALAGEDEVCGVLLSLGVLSDIFDGVLARRWKVSTPALRTWDSRADVAFWACAFGALIVSRPDWLAVLGPAIALFIALEATNHAFSFYRFGREASPHHYLSKAFGLALWAFVATAFVTGRLHPLFGIAATIGVLSQVEAFLITARLRAWRCDVPSVFTLRL